MTKNRYLEFDILKGIAILFVIFIHMSGEFLVQGKPTNYLFETLYFFTNVFARFSVPLFILLSGILMGMFSYKEKTASIIRKRVQFILIPYIIWSLFYTYFFNYAWGRNLSIWDGLVYAYSAYHMYFILIVLQLSIFFLFIRKLTLKYTHIIILLIIQLIINDYFIEYPVHFLGYNSITTFIPWIFIFTLGIFIGRNYDDFKYHVKNNYKLYFLSLLISGIYLYFRFIFLFNGGISIYKIANGIPIFITLSIFAFITGAYYSLAQDHPTKYQHIGVFSLLGRYSFGIYLVHPIFVNYIRTYFDTITLAGGEIC